MHDFNQLQYLSCALYLDMHMPRFKGIQSYKPHLAACYHVPPF